MNNLLISPSFINNISSKAAVEQILQINERSLLFGIYLTDRDALELVETRSQALRDFGRIEIGSATIAKIIEMFCDSRYIFQANYAETIHELLETFYYIKNESLDLISDDELIEIMKDYFENRCQGSIELLQHRELEHLGRNLRFGLPYDSNMEDINMDMDEEEDDEE